MWMRECPVAIVCGYDRFSDLHVYADRVASHLKSSSIGTVVVTGGFTDRLSHLSEAAVIASVLSVRLPHVLVILEEEAMTTLDNLVFGRAVAMRMQGRVAAFHVYCDGPHLAKVAVLTRIVLGRAARVFSVPRRVPWHVYAFEPLSTVVEAVCATAPPLRRALSRFAAWAKGVESVRRPSATQAL
jgi:hypothetical protein